MNEGRPQASACKLAGVERGVELCGGVTRDQASACGLAGVVRAWRGAVRWCDSASASTAATAEIIRRQSQPPRGQVDMRAQRHACPSHSVLPSQPTPTPPRPPPQSSLSVNSSPRLPSHSLITTASSASSWARAQGHARKGTRVLEPACSAPPSPRTTTAQRQQERQS